MLNVFSGDHEVFIVSINVLLLFMRSLGVYSGLDELQLSTLPLEALSSSPVYLQGLWLVSRLSQMVWQAPGGATILVLTTIRANSRQPFGTSQARNAMRDGNSLLLRFLARG